MTPAAQAEGRRPVGRPRGPTIDPAVRRAQLLDAATRVIRRRGPGAPMDELAAEAGLTKPVLYAHFGDRQGLASALAERFVGQIGERLVAAFVAETAPRRQLHHALDAFVGFIEEDPNVYQFIVREAVTSASTGQTASIARLKIFDALGRLITAGLTQQLDTAGLDTANAEPMAFATMGMVFGATEWWLDRGLMTRDELVGLLTNLLWDGLSRGPARPV